MGAFRLRNARGFTFVEVFISGIILAIMAVAVLELLTRQSDFFEVSTTAGELRTDAERAVGDIARELRLATRDTPGVAPSITVPAAPGNTAVTFFVPQDVDGQNGVLDAIGDVEWDATNPIQFQYDAAARQLRRVEGAAVRVVANDVEAVTFEDRAIDNSLYNDEVKVNLTLSRTTPHRRTVAETASTVVRLRN